MYMHFNCSLCVVCYRKCIELVTSNLVLLQFFNRYGAYGSLQFKGIVSLSDYRSTALALVLEWKFQPICDCCRYWLIALFDWDIRLESNAACKIHVFLTYYTTQLSSWILVLITLDCFISVSFPLKVLFYTMGQTWHFIHRNSKWSK